MLSVICVIIVMSLFTSSAESKDLIKLKFKPDKTFKIVQFNDTQDDQSIDLRTVALIEAVCDKSAT